jgi:hypothetical protein
MKPILAALALNPELSHKKGQEVSSASDDSCFFWDKDFVRFSYLKSIYFRYIQRFLVWCPNCHRIGCSVYFLNLVSRALRVLKAMN